MKSNVINVKHQQLRSVNEGHCTRNVVINSSGNRRWPMAIKRRGTAYSLNIGLLGEKRFHRKLISLIVNSAMSIVDNVI